MAARNGGFLSAARFDTHSAIAVLTAALGLQAAALAQPGPNSSSGRPLRSVVARQSPDVVAEQDLIVPGAPVEVVRPRVVDDGRFEEVPSGGPVISDGPVVSDGMISDGMISDGMISNGSIDGSFAEAGPVFVGGGFGPGEGHGRPWFNAFCEPVGLAQRLAWLIHPHVKNTCWTGRVDALVLWRTAPQERPLYTTNPAVVPFSIVALDASHLESPAAGGARLQFFRHDPDGSLLEFGYLYGGQFFSEQLRPNFPGAYLTAPPGLDGVDFPDPVRGLDQVGAQLTGAIQSAEINRRVCVLDSTQFLYGFRWLQWYELSTVADTFGAVEEPPTFGADIYTTRTINNLWGGQIGFDSLLLRTRHNFRVEGLVKAGVYANNAGQNSRYQQLEEGQAPFSSQVTVNGWPASASFVGEVGMTGVVPLHENWDFRFGYLGLWVTGLAQPTNQLSGQNLAQGETPRGSLNTVGTVIVQGVTLGLEGRW